MFLVRRLAGLLCVLGLLLIAGSANAQTATATPTLTATPSTTPTISATPSQTPTARPTIIPPGPQGGCQYTDGCATSPRFGSAACCYDTTNQWWYFWDYFASTPAFEPTGHRTTIPSLPTCNAAQAGLQAIVVDSTSVVSEGQTCVSNIGGSYAWAVCNGSVWKCF